MPDSEYNRLVHILEKLCRFCPVCGAVLLTVTAKFTTVNPPYLPEASKINTYNYKTCPKGHGNLGVDVDWDPSDGKPDATFELDVLLFNEDEN